MKSTIFLALAASPLALVATAMPVAAQDSADQTLPSPAMTVILVRAVPAKSHPNPCRCSYRPPQIGRAHLFTPCPNAHLLCPPVLENKQDQQTQYHIDKHKQLLQ